MARSSAALLCWCVASCVHAPPPPPPSASRPAQPSSAAVRLSIVGSIENPDRTWNPLFITEPPEVKALLLDLARSPRTAAHVDERLRRSRTRAGDLFRLRLLREEKGRVLLNFVFLTREDRALVSAVAERYSASLADALSDPRLYEELQRYGVPTVGRDRLAFIVLGCLALDWRSLETLAAADRLLYHPPRPGGNRYLLVGEERTERRSLRGVYWGSHSDAAGPAVLLSFGDHEPRGRAAFPDLLWNMGWSRDRFPRAFESELFALHEDLLQQIGAHVASTLLAVRGGARTAEEIGRDTGIPPAKQTAVLRLLDKLKYLHERDGKHELLVPVLAQRDRAMVDAVVQRAMRVVSAWTAARYQRIRDELAGITPLRHGVDYREVYSQVWHYIFGYTNRRLARRGLIFDTYRNKEPFAGFLPAVLIAPLKAHTRGAASADLLVEEDVPDARVAAVVSAYERAHATLARSFGAHPARLTVRIYRTRDRFLLDLRDIAGMSRGSAAFFALGGAPRPLGGQLYVPPDLTPQNVCHELAHSFVEAVSGPAYRKAKWLDEGYASFFAQRTCGSDAWPGLGGPALALGEMTTEESWHALAGDRRRRAYLQSMLLVKALVDRHGEDKVISLIRDLAQRGLEQALKRRLGMRLAEVSELIGN